MDLKEKIATFTIFFSKNYRERGKANYVILTLPQLF